MNKYPLRKDLIEAWNRYVNKTNTGDDIALILDSIRDDDYIQEFIEVFNETWDKSMNELPPTPEERKEIYRKEFALFLAEYEKKQKTQRNTYSRFRKIWYAAAAVLLLGLLIPAIFLYVKPKTEQTLIQYVEEVTQRGEIRNIILPDQTEVTLNAGSLLKYPAVFTGDERSVELYGET